MASFSGFDKKETGELMTFCSWGENVLALLPRTDYILFMQEGKKPQMAEWDRVVEVVGNLMQPLDMYPPRYRVADFPTDEQLAAMGATRP